MLIGYAAFSIRLNPIQLNGIQYTTELGSIYDCILRLYYL